MGVFCSGSMYSSSDYSGGSSLFLRLEFLLPVPFGCITEGGVSLLPLTMFIPEDTKGPISCSLSPLNPLLQATFRILKRK